jgi:hypothetical protein
MGSPQGNLHYVIGLSRTDARVLETGGMRAIGVDGRYWDLISEGKEGTPTLEDKSGVQKESSDGREG